jgi:hypothetical protein
MRSLKLKLRHVEDYRKLRREAYPSVGEQLDALWHGMDEGKIEKVEPFYSMIKEVKTKFPKEV